MVYIIFILIGFLSAFVGSIAGLGGGVIFVPSILLLAQFFPEFFDWVSPQALVGMSLLVMIFTGLSSTYTYLKYKRVDLKSGSIFLLASVPGSLFGVWLNRYVEGDSFQLYFGLLMLFITVMFFLRKKEATKPLIQTQRGVKRTFEIKDKTFTYSYPITLALLIAFVVGLCSGLFGIGGGSLMVPTMILLFGFPPQIAAPTSMFMIFISSSVSSIAHISLGHIIWEYVIFFIPGSWIGGIVGAKVSQRMKGNTIEWILRILIVLIGIRLIWKGLAGM
ncbi:sulfite exporter TauE/SafE family protein [Salinibacillus xinjiangensis]|uniref:Probable membrane transporter protein n=1 Tax=Salinibacillus xinjiangensis TaxID=1229268 RepID=A0A6G1X2J2_9BACI|nr:sulfite exporter TauE/SafE family protein [Salinibacillus xinjiangensis]MRG85162.1 TSUP family transporter [Salinibacillus xinjiangensis]